MAKENKNSFTYDFKQQNLKAWQPAPTPFSTICLLVSLGIIIIKFFLKSLSGIFFLSFGIAMIILNDQVTEITLRYDDKCITIGQICTISFTVASSITDKVFIFYYLENFYQNHRRYIKSRNDDQLGGAVKHSYDLTSCEPIIKNMDIGKEISFGGITLNPDEPANPCGLIAKSFFNGLPFQ